MHVPVIVSLFFIGFAGVWFGLVEDFKLGFALGLLFLASATFMVFSGRPGTIPPPRPRSAATQRRAISPAEMVLPVAVAVGFLLGAVGVWFGLVEDIKIAMLAGIVVLAGAVLATFRGKATPF